MKKVITVVVPEQTIDVLWYHKYDPESQLDRIKVKKAALEKVDVEISSLVEELHSEIDLEELGLSKHKQVFFKWDCFGQIGYEGPVQVWSAREISEGLMELTLSSEKRSHLYTVTMEREKLTLLSPAEFSEQVLTFLTESKGFNLEELLSLRGISFQTLTGEALEEEFEKLRESFRNETRYSSYHDKISHPLYKQIMELGPGVVPLLKKELKVRPSKTWFWALTCLTGFDPVLEGLTTKEACEVWINILN